MPTRLPYWMAEFGHGVFGKVANVHRYSWHDAASMRAQQRAVVHRLYLRQHFDVGVDQVSETQENLTALKLLAVEAEAVARTEVIKKLWDYIKANGLQDTTNKRAINADAKLKPVFGKDQITMFELAGIAGKHLRPAGD